MPGVWPYQPDDPVEGEAKAWEALAEADPEEAARRALVDYDASRKTFSVQSLGQAYELAVAERAIATTSEQGDRVLGRLGYLIRLALVWYPVRATDAGPTGILVAPKELPGGDVFMRGSHQLPLKELARAFDTDEAVVARAARSLGGAAAHLGDRAWGLAPLPRVPVTVGFWRGDEEFEPRASLLFDASAADQLPIDLLWSAAMCTVMALLEID